MKIEHITKKDLRALKLSWAEVTSVLDDEAYEGAHVEDISVRDHPVIAFEQGMECAANGFDIAEDNWTIVTGFQSRQAKVARTDRKYLIDKFKAFIKNDRQTDSELYEYEVGKL